MCAELQLQECKRPALVGINLACAFVGFFGLVNGLVNVIPAAMGLGMLAVVAGSLGALVAKD